MPVTGPDTHPLPEGFPDEVTVLLVAGDYAKENPLAFWAWAKEHGYIATHGTCDHTDAEHADNFSEALQTGADAVVTVFTVGLAIAGRGNPFAFPPSGMN